MKTLTTAALLIASNLFCIVAHGQARITPGEIKEISIHNAVAGLGGGISADITVVAEAGAWHSYLTRKTRSGIDQRFKPYDSVLHRFISVVSPMLVNHLLNGIAVIKPAITPSTFGLTAPGLIAGLKKDAKTPITSTPGFEKLITQTAIKKAIAQNVVDIMATDDYEYCEVDIVTRTKHTVKISTRNVCPTKLPWTIGERNTYDISINNFVVAAIGNEDVPNKQPLKISSLKESIFKSIDEQNPGAPIATFRWQHNYPDNLKLLNERFTVKEGLLYGDVYSCVLKTNTMPTNAIFETRIDMARAEDVKTAIKYAALIDDYIKANNFMFKYYTNRPDCQISFSYTTGAPPYYSLQFLRKKLPDLAKADSSQVLNVWVGAPDDASTWMIFPGNQLLLTYHAVTAPGGKTAPIYPPRDQNVSWITQSNTYYLFDETGNVLNQGVGF